MPGAELAERLVALHEGQIDSARVVLEFRRSAVLVPTRGGEPLAADLGGVQWLYAFTGEDALMRYAQAGELGPEVPYLTVYGWRLMDVAVPAMGVPAGVAVDVAGPAPFLLPPVRGVVPDAVAVDRG
ncbi:hypothetical protein E6W39_34595 [Kitasatospora acidiphila]|uniref:SseB protein N-terminal domain-containing protein n=1 Tax=Kitasatospora acidiphila TaxID=2567942 RepID=A0A540WDD5_9ACTN|nr:SseB family protein [Kitasatospora acidiphila]TQF06404.1 hypothetical protein E6W39_34595 [Kitasatospora acidiphila]